MTVERNEVVIDKALKLIVRSSFIVFITVILSKLLAWAYRVIIVRYYGIEAYGYYSLLILVLGLFVTFGSLGFVDGLLRYIPKYLGEKKNQNARYLLNYSIVSLLVSGLISVVLLFFFSDYIAIKVFKDVGFSSLLKVFSLLILAWIFSNVFLTTINSLEKIGWYSFLSDVLPNISRVGIILILIFLGSSMNAVFISYGASLIILVTFSYIIFKRYSHVLIKKEISLAEKESMKKEFRAYSFPMVFTGGVSKLNFWIDSLIIAIFLTPSDVGFYNAAIPVALLLHIIPELFYPLFFPLITRMISSKNREVAKDISKQLGKWVFMINLPIFILLFFFPDVVLGFIFNISDPVTSSSLRILSLGAFITSFLYISQRLLLIHGFSKTLLFNSVLALVANIILNVILIPKYGIMGAAIATSSVWVAVGILFTIQSHRLSAITPLKRAILKVILLSIIPIILLISFKNLMTNITSFLIGGVIFTLIYSLLIYFFALDKKDLSILISIKNKLFKAKKETI
jgi:O-antigen/teichoic acid export membrane protein